MNRPRKMLAAALLIAPIVASAADAAPPPDGPAVTNGARYMLGAHLLQAAANPQLGAYLAGYVSAASDAGQGVLHCSPDSLSSVEVLGAATQWLQAHPEAQAAAASTAVLMSLQQRYPCNGTVGSEPVRPAPRPALLTSYGVTSPRMRTTSN